MKKSKTLTNSPMKIVFARNFDSPLTHYHGMEIAMGRLNGAQIKEVAKLIDHHAYFGSKYFSEWSQYDDIYHRTGILFGGEPSELNDRDGLSVGKFRIGKAKVNEITLPYEDDGAYLLTFRNETVYFIAEGETPSQRVVKIDLSVDEFTFFDEMADISIAMLKGASIEDRELDAATGDASGAIYDTYQFIVVNREILCCLTNNQSGEYQYPFGTVAEDYPCLCETISDAAPHITRALRSVKLK
jgi:hypothetical protein